MADRLQQLSFTDGLTGAMNRNAFIRDITPPIPDKGYGWGVIFVDVNGLKETNDQYGHVAGDELLIRTYQKISSDFLEMHPGTGQAGMNLSFSVRIWGRRNFWKRRRS